MNQTLNHACHIENDPSTPSFNQLESCQFGWQSLLFKHDFELTVPEAIGLDVKNSNWDLAQRSKLSAN